MNCILKLSTRQLTALSDLFKCKYSGFFFFFHVCKIVAPLDSLRQRWEANVTPTGRRELGHGKGRVGPPATSDPLPDRAMLS